MSNQCKHPGCDAVILWAVRLKNGKRIPLVALDPKFPAAPRYKISARRSDGVVECERDDAGEYISHFSNCPGAPDFSKGRRK